MRTLLFITVLASTGCMTEPIATAPTNNAGIEVDLLFQHDGCNVYRFRDVTYHYYVKCNGAGPNASILPDKCGKSGHECGSVPVAN
jgi:hypothetical protein